MSAGLDYFGGYDRIMKGMTPDAFTRATDRSYAPEAEQELRDILSWTVPTSPAEAGAMLMFGPGGKLVKLGGLGSMLGGYSPDTEAGLLSKLASIFPDVAKTRRDPINLVRQEGVIKPKGGNWVTNPRGPLSILHDRTSNYGQLDQEYKLWNDSMKGLEESMANDPSLVTQLQDAYQLAQENLAPLQRRKAVADWVSGPLNKYVKNQMGTPEDPLRALAEEGKWFKGEYDAINLEYYEELLKEIGQSRQRQGFPAEGLAVNPDAKIWELLSDEAIFPQTKDMVSAEIRELNPWLEKLGPKDIVYDGSKFPATIFDKLTDDMLEATNSSKLPDYLKLTPQKISQMGVEKAARWQNELQAYYDALELAKVRGLAERMPVIKEYPNGYKWIEIARPEGVPLNEAEDMVQKLLDYEGNIMNHCVGDYCDDVLEGLSRVISLRDPSGKPHVTIEARPAGTADEFGAVPEAYYNVAAEQLLGNNRVPANEIKDWMFENHDSIYELANKLAAEANKGGQWSINQIRGNSNSKPKDEYLSYIQNFVKDSPLGRIDFVGDFEHTGFVDPRILQRLSSIKGQQYIKQDNSFGEWPDFEVNPDGYYTMDELEELVKSKAPADIDEHYWNGFYNALKNPR